MKYLKRLALLAIFLLPCIREVGANECALFDKGQRDVLQSAYDYGKGVDAGWTMAAIAWKESSAGKRPVNWSDPSFGNYHVLLKTATNMEGFDMNQEPIRALFVAIRLMIDKDYSAKQSLEVLSFWRVTHSDDWPKVWASYNAGYNWAGIKGRNYSKDISNKIKYLRQHNCLKR